jgi:hypothetical protein
VLKSDVKLLQAIANLQGNPDFDKFHEWITDSYKELARLFVLKTDNSDSQHRIEQGRALNCYHIKTVIETARQQLQIVKEKKEG